MTQPRKLRVLIADDVQETRRNTRLMLSMIPEVEVTAIASNGAQALQLVEQHRPDIIIADINMPEMNGLALARAVLQKYPGMGYIIMSSERDAETFHAARALGVQEYLTKPYTVDELEAAIRRVTARLTETRRRLALAREQQQEQTLKQLATEYAKARRTDDQAVTVFERLANNPACDIYWLRTLAMMYVIRQEWGKLKRLADRLENQSKTG
ncbi:MAG: response regulator [Anaerolineales bacterium]